jgi:hypothetical protein
MKLLHIGSSLGLAALFFTGCASSPVAPDTHKNSLGGSGMSMNMGARAPVLPRLQVYPTSPNVQRQDPIMVTADPLPIWNATKVQKVQLDAHVDESGRLHPPTEMYVRVENGGWNLNAVRKPGGYIPPENAVKPYNLPGANYGPSYTVPRASSGSPTSLFDMRQVKITGLTSQADRRVAEGMKADNEVCVFDNRVGWVLVPQSAMKGTVQIPEQSKRVTPVVQNGRVTTLGRPTQSIPQTLPSVGQPNPRPAASSPAPRATVAPKPSAAPTNSLFDEL